jgi:hypothetical protein
MNLGELRQELALIVQDPSLEEHYDRWLNESIQRLAMEFDLPSLKRLDPLPFSVVSTAWYRQAPEIFQKKLFRCYNATGSPVAILERLEELERLDWDHDEAGDHISHIAVLEQGDVKQIAYYPKADETVQLWFYEKPALLVKDGDSPACIPREYHGPVIIPDVVVKNFELLQDMVKDVPFTSLKYWMERKRIGIYGGPAGEIGFINWLVKSRGGPRRHGGRDPIGGRGW